MPDKRNAARLLALGLLVATSVELSSALAIRLLAHFGGLEYEPLSTILSESQITGVRWIVESKGSGYYRYDADLGWSTTPASSFEQLTQNSLGARSLREYAPSPPPDTLRVVAVGDSFVHGDDVADGAEWPARIEALVPGVEMINLGVSGYGPGQAYLRWQRDGIPLEPHVAIFGIMGEDPYRATSVFWPFRFKDTGWVFSKPRFVRKNDGLELLRNPMASPDSYEALLTDPTAELTKLGEHDTYFADRGYGFWSELDFLPSIQLLSIAVGKWRSAGRPLTVDDGHYNPDSAAYGITAQLIQRFCKENRARGVHPIVLFLPDRHDLEVRRSGQAWRYQTLIEFAEEIGCPVWDASDGLENLAPDRSLDELFQGFHYTELGNGIVAEALAPKISELRSPSPRRGGSQPHAPQLEKAAAHTGVHRGPPEKTSDGTTRRSSAKPVS